MINPKDLIETLTVEELCDTAEAYYKSIPNKEYLMAKPFGSLLEVSDMLFTMGMLLSGLHLGKTMKVLDFGAGPCWFSRFLNQMQCQTISCDTSQTALDVGRTLFERFPIVGEYISDPVFLPFNGHRIDLPDDSVDRIICYDVFHHLPNQEQIISEFGRVLKNGGIAGFSEPGKFHSQSPHSQYEMKNFNVLENDIDINEIYSMAMHNGFDHISLKLLSNENLSIEEYNFIMGGPRRKGVKISSPVKTIKKISKNIRQLMTDKTVFFLYKGAFVPDSRSYEGLAHNISIGCTEFCVSVDQALKIPVQVTNTGIASWLHENIRDIGVVKIGTHLYDYLANQMIEQDFSRHGFQSDILPGQASEQMISLKFPKTGRYKVSIDLLSEDVCWFESVGSIPQSIMVTVE